MELQGFNFPGLPTPGIETQSQRSYSWDPLDTLSTQGTHLAELRDQTAENITWVTPFGSYTPQPQRYPGQDFGNTELVKAVFTSQPDWWRGVGLGAIQTNWDDIRGMFGVGYGLYGPHQPMNPIPVNKLVEPGSGFVLPATFLGQPLVPMSAPPGA